VGSECPSSLSEAVLEAGADIGLAHDGDGDRLVVCDEKGSIIPGDVLLGMYALDALKYSALGGDTLVVTVQSNLGLDFAVKEAGGSVERVDVGDRNVAEKMRAIGSNLGGESSGHILFSDVCPTGDGLLAALQLLRMLKSANKPLSELSRGIHLFPQETKNLQVVEKTPLEQLTGLQSALLEAEAMLSSEGRILLRYSGTESKLRILVEAKTAEMAKKVMQIIVTEACNGLRVL
jgi:phosphoglucosamine mutase